VLVFTGKPRPWYLVRVLMGVVCVPAAPAAPRVLTNSSVPVSSQRTMLVVSVVHVPAAQLRSTVLEFDATGPSGVSVPSSRAYLPRHQGPGMVRACGRLVSVRIERTACRHK
jgi:hypothetical protein